MNTATTDQPEPTDDVSASTSVDQPNGSPYPHPSEEVPADGSPTDYSHQEETEPNDNYSTSTPPEQTKDTPHPSGEAPTHASPVGHHTQNVNNPGDVDTQVNIQYLDKLVQGSSEAAEFLDPTTEFSPADTDLPPFPDQNSVRHVFEHIAEERIVVIDCLDETVTESAVYALSDLYPHDHARRQLLFEGRNEERADSLKGTLKNSVFQRALWIVGETLIRSC